MYKCLKKKRYLSPNKAHIVIDAGHGGEDSGASAFGLKEKAVTIDIARRVYSMLKSEGYRVFLTRNVDDYLSVVDRFQLARQLKADLFVSIHANAVAGLESVSGVETHHLDGTYFFGQNKNSCYLLLEKGEAAYLPKLADRLLQEKIAASKVLSQSIQKSIVSYLNQKKIGVVDRGVKASGFRTLLRSEVPSSIVEVGFITNKTESKRLKQPIYRHFLAQGISDGVKRFFTFQ